MIKIDFKEFIRDRMWFGWYWTCNGGSLTSIDIDLPGWRRSSYTPVHNKIVVRINPFA